MEMRELFRQQLQSSGKITLTVTKDVTEEEAVERPHGLAPIVWQVGHVTYYDAVLISQVLGGEPDVPAEYAELFKQGSSGEGDFPAFADVRAVAERVQAKMLELADVDPLQELDGGSLYSNVGGALMFTLQHRGWHTGKIMTLRALIGKPVMF